MALKNYKPVTASLRGTVLIDRSELYKGKPVKGLTEGKNHSGGRNNHGRIPARFIGAMGSRLSCERRSERLRQAGFSSEAVARISAPVGLDLGGGSATETALSIFAEIVAVANGRGGGRLAEANGPIHAVA